MLAVVTGFTVLVMAVVGGMQVQGQTILETPPPAFGSTLDEDGCYLAPTYVHALIWLDRESGRNEYVGTLPSETTTDPVIAFQQITPIAETVIWDTDKQRVGSFTTKDAIASSIPNCLG